MKIGFRIDIQSDLNNEELSIAKKYADDFIIRTLSHPQKRYGGIKSHGGRDTPYSRGSCMSLPNELTMLRINGHKRIFAILKINNVKGETYGKLKLINKPQMFTYAQVGDIKG